MNKIFLLFFCVIFNNCLAQTQILSKDYIEKNGSVITNRLLNVTDFKGEPDLKSPEIAETRSTIDMHIEKSTFLSDRTEKLFIKVYPYFFKSSWIKDDAKNNPDTSFLISILKHEQDHYDLAILASIEMEKAFRNNSIFDVKTERKDLKRIYDQYYTTYFELNKFYETDVDHGRDPWNQNLWNKMILIAVKEKSWKSLIDYKNNSSSIGKHPITSTIIVKGYTGGYSFDLNHENDLYLDKKYDDITLITIAPNENYEAKYNEKTVYIKQNGLLADSSVQTWRKEKLKNTERSLNKTIYNKYVKEFGSKYAKDVIQGNIRVGMPRNAILEITGYPQTITSVISDRTENWVYRRRNDSETYFLFFKDDILIKWIDYK